MRTRTNRVVIEAAKRHAVEYCQKNQLDTALLGKQSVYAINGKIIFAQPSANKSFGLRNDRETRPQPTLVVEKKADGFHVSQTDYTLQFLKKADLK